jgi:hypothetical protein
MLVSRYPQEYDDDGGGIVEELFLYVGGQLDQLIERHTLLQVVDVDVHGTGTKACFEDHSEDPLL